MSPQVSTENACGPPAPGHATCFAQVEVARGTHRPIVPRVSRATAGVRLERSRWARTGAERSTVDPFSLSLTQTAATPSEPAGTQPPQEGSPAFVQQAYDLTALSASQPAGVDTIAIVDAYDDPNAESDLAMYRGEFGLPPCTSDTGCFTKMNQNGKNNPNQLPHQDPTGGWELEESLDMDAVSALCPLCHIELVEANSNGLGDLQQAARTASTKDANQISMSFGDVSATDPEPAAGWTFPGISSLAATGDDGYNGAGLISFPAGEPAVTAVGGTTLQSVTDPTDPNAARGVTESAWDQTGSGCETSVAQPSFQMGSGSGCSGRSAADVSAMADGADLIVFDSTPIKGVSGTFYSVGGTSLATPLVAAFEAITGVDTAYSPAWAYARAGVLNDITTGDNDSMSGDTGGTCTLDIQYICTARTGYDGPTGNGTITGAVVAGAPGIGGTYSTTAPIPPTPPNTVPTTFNATLFGGAYPNGYDTTVYFEYGLTTSYGQTTPAPTDIGSGTAAVLTQATLTGLTAGLDYHYRLVASNASGTAYGPDEVFTAGTPNNTTLPTITTTTPQVGNEIDATAGNWNPSGPATYQWQYCTTADASSCTTPIPGATSDSYVPTSGDVGQFINVAVTETNVFGTATASSKTVGPIAVPPPPPPPPPPPTTTTTTPTPTPTPTPTTIATTPITVTPLPSAPKVVSAPKLTGNAKVGSTLHLTGGSYANGSVTKIGFYRCTRTCTPLKASKASSFKLTAPLAGYLIRARVTIAGAGGTTSAFTSDYAGPVTSTSAAALKLPSRAGVAAKATLAVRTPSHRELAQIGMRMKGTAAALTIKPEAPKVTLRAYVLNGLKITSFHAGKKLSVIVGKGESVAVAAVSTAPRSLKRSAGAGAHH